MRLCEWCEEKQAPPRARYCSHECFLAKRKSRRQARKLNMTEAEHAAQREYDRLKAAQYRAEHPERCRARAKRYRRRHRSEILPRLKAWKEANRPRWQATKRRYEQQKRLSDPAWVEARRTYNREYRRKQYRRCDLPAEICGSAGTVHKHCRHCGWPVRVWDTMCVHCRSERRRGLLLREEAA